MHRIQSKKLSHFFRSASQSQLAKLLAGGTDVLVQMHSGLNKPMFS